MIYRTIKPQQWYTFFNLYLRKATAATNILCLQFSNFQSKTKTNEYLKQWFNKYSDFPLDYLKIAKNIDGKPIFSSPALKNLNLSISHSYNHLYVALVWDYKLGIDFEHRSRQVNSSVADYYFHADEIKELKKQPSADAYAQLFLRLWTAKEAYAKALGVGINRKVLSYNMLPIVNLDEPMKADSETFYFHNSPFSQLSKDHIVSICTSSNNVDALSFISYKEN